MGKQSSHIFSETSRRAKLHNSANKRWTTDPKHVIFRVLTEYTMRSLTRYAQIIGIDTDNNVEDHELRRLRWRVAGFLATKIQ